MARKSRPVGPARNADFDEQAWAINVAILILAGLVAGVVIGVSDFSELTLLYNGYTHLAVVGVMLGLMLVASRWLEGKMRRRLQLAVLLSLIAHLGSVVLICQFPVAIAFPTPKKDRPGGGREQPDYQLVAPDYHWTVVEQSDVEQDFNTPVEAVAPDENVVTATVERDDVERPTPVAELPRLPQPESAPPLAPQEQASPMELARAEPARPQAVEEPGSGRVRRDRKATDPSAPEMVAETEESRPAEAKPKGESAALQPGAVAASRQTAEAPRGPRAASEPGLERLGPAPAAEVAGPARRMNEKIELAQAGPAARARRTGDAALPTDNAEVAPSPLAAKEPAGLIEGGSTQVARQHTGGPARAGTSAVEAGRALPAMTSVAQLPAAVAPRSGASQPEAGGGDPMPSRPGTLRRTDRGGISMPSRSLLGETELAMAPAAAGGVAGSRIEATSNVAVERSGAERAPAGKNLAAKGSEEFGTGSGQRIARIGIPRGRGDERPSLSPTGPALRLARTPTGTSLGGIPAADGGSLPTVIASPYAGQPAGPSADASVKIGHGTGPGTEFTARGDGTNAVRASRIPGPLDQGPLGPVGVAQPGRILRQATPPVAMVTGGMTGGSGRPVRTASGVGLPGDVGSEVASAVADGTGTASTPGGLDGVPLGAEGKGEETRVTGLTGRVQSTVRAGAIGSSTDRGAPLPAAVARRAAASEPGDGGKGLGPSRSATLPRTQMAGGSNLPAAAAPSNLVGTPGAGGVMAMPGGAASNLDVGPRATIHRTASADAPRGRNVLAAGSVDFGTGSGLMPAVPGPVSGSGRGVPTLANNAGSTSGGGSTGSTTGTAGAPAGPGSRVVRASSTIGLPDPVAESVGGQLAGKPGEARPGPGELADVVRGGPAGGATAPAAGAERRGFQGRDPNAADQGIGDGRRGGLRVEVVAVGPEGFATGLIPGTAGLPGRRVQGAGDPVQVASSSGPGRPVIHRAGGSLGIDGAVREPTEFYQHRRAGRNRGVGPGEGDGGAYTDRAVETGLDFFARVQFPDGHWSLNALPDGLQLDDAALGEYESDTAATGLVLLSYLGAGYTHLDDKHRTIVRLGIEWLAKHQKPDGDLFVGGSKFARLYSHGIAAMALCEAYGMTQDPELREAAQKAVNFIVKSQDKELGGWRYEPGKESDTSVTGWQLMALKSAQMAGLEVPAETLNRVSGWLDHAQGPGSDGRYVYNPENQDNDRQRDGRQPTKAMTAEAMLMRMYLGQNRTDARLIRGAEYLKENLPEVGTKENSTRDCYYWYYATQAMYQMQGDYWIAWNNRLRPLLETSQVQKGDLTGSWHPVQPVRDRWGPVAGRVYVTAMHLLMLEVEYRHLPLFQELGK